MYLATLYFYNMSDRDIDSIDSKVDRQCTLYLIHFLKILSRDCSTRRIEQKSEERFKAKHGIQTYNIGSSETLQLVGSMQEVSPVVTELVNDIGLRNNRVFAASQHVVVQREGRLHPLPQSLTETLASSLLSPAAKLRFILEPLLWKQVQRPAFAPDVMSQVVTPTCVRCTFCHKHY